MLHKNHIKKRGTIVFFVVIFLSFVFVSCGSSRGVFRKKKDCGCGTWSQIPQQEIIYASAHEDM